MLELERKIKKEIYRKSLYDFVKDFWNTADPARFVDGKLVQFYCETFQYMCRKWVGYTPVKITMPEVKEGEVLIDIRNNKQNININVPPRHTKSMIFNVFGPVWLWINAPIKAASVSHTTALASEMQNKRIKILNSEKFRFYFGDEVWLSQTSKGKLVDTRGGELYSIARESFTGHGADIIINDDLTNAETARRDREEMLSAWSYYQNTMPSRINDRNKYIIINIQQRLAPNDITGHILQDLKLANEYTFVVLPAEFHQKTYIICPISGDVLVFEKGSTLWPERFGDYSSLKIEVGPSVYETQYLQNPIASDKAIIKEELIIEKDPTEIPDISQADMVYASHDFPVKDKDTSDFLGSVLAYKVNATLYITDCLEKRMAFVKSVAYVQQLNDIYPGSIQIIEDKANGSPILQQLQDVVPGMQAFNPGANSKSQRLESASVYMNAGNVVFVKRQFDKLTQTYHLPESLLNLKQRLLNFPFVEHDDIVDAFSMMILYVFMDRRYAVYGRSFNDKNIIKLSELSANPYSTIFFNKEGDLWKVCEIECSYSENTKLILRREHQFKANLEDGLRMLKEFSPTSKVFIDCSATDAMTGMLVKNSSVERYEIDDFDKSVSQLNLAFAKKVVLISEQCKLAKNDVETFKFNKSKDETVKYHTQKDGFVACLRLALRYYGGII